MRDSTNLVTQLFGETSVLLLRAYSILSARPVSHEDLLKVCRFYNNYKDVARVVQAAIVCDDTSAKTLATLFVDHMAASPFLPIHYAHGIVLGFFQGAAELEKQHIDHGQRDALANIIQAMVKCGLASGSDVPAIDDGEFERSLGLAVKAYFKAGHELGLESIEARDRAQDLLPTLARIWEAESRAPGHGEFGDAILRQLLYCFIPALGAREMTRSLALLHYQRQRDGYLDRVQQVLVTGN